MSEFKVVLVPDQSASLIALGETLRVNGFQVTISGNSLDALDELMDGGADALVLSETLSPLNGFQLACLLKSSKNTCQLPVIIVTDKEADIDNFWKKTPLADSIIEKRDLLEKEQKQCALIESLVKSAYQQGFSRKRLKGSKLDITLRAAKANALFPALINSLLLECFVGHFARQLGEAVGSKVEFMATLFHFMRQSFNPDVAGLLLVDPASPWGIFQISGVVSKKAFAELVERVTRELSLLKEPQIILHGETNKQDGAKLPSCETIIVRGKDDKILGAVVLAWTRKHVLENAAYGISKQLEIQMPSVFKLLLKAKEIEALRQREQYWSSIDPLTGLYNLEFFLGFLQQQLLFSQRQKLPVGVIILDIDRFIELNKEFGDEVGDHVLTSVANRILNITRGSDLVARYSGSQFAIVLPNTDRAGAQTLAEKIRIEVAQMQFIEKSGEPRKVVTVSAGCAEFDMNDLNPETILKDAKSALERAKDKGRNRVSI